MSLLEEVVIDLINMFSKRYKLAFHIKLFTHIAFIDFMLFTCTSKQCILRLKKEDTDR